MAELTLATEVAKFIQIWGLPGLVVVLLGYLIWSDRQRQKNIDADRLIWTNHLSGMIKENSTSNTQLAVGLTKLSESVNNFQSRCSQIQDDFQNEVDRLKKG